MQTLILIIFTLVGGSLGFNNFTDLMNLTALTSQIHPVINNAWFGMVLGALIGYLVGVLVVDPILRALKRLTQFITQLSLSYVICGSIGLVFGLIISWLINFSLQSFNIPFVNEVVSIIITFTLAYIGFYIGTSRHQDIADLLHELFSRDKDDQDKAKTQSDTSDFIQYKILDTSSIIDGRIIEVIRSGFLEGTFVVSTHVLKELQYIADSSDNLKRTHGRRGLDMLNELQEDEKIKVEMSDKDFKDVEDVDIKLVHLAKEMNGAVITNDYNLNKVAQFQKVPVLNINELSNMVKPVVIPGEQMRVTIVKKGTERAQGVAYLDNGTMVVVEEGKHHINESLDVVVTSSLQTNAGRMIFAKIADEPNIGEAEF